MDTFGSGRASPDQTERIFTREAMSRPLFEDPGEQVEREDPYSGPQGFMIGDEFTPTRPELAQQYFDAAHLLLEAIRGGLWEDYKLVGPALFLYRHSLELLLKSLIGSAPRTHDLAALARMLDAASVRRSGRHVPAWIISRLDEIAAIDPGSTAFRYGENFDRCTGRNVSPVTSATYVSLPHLQRSMLTLNAALAGAIADVARDHPVYFPEEPDLSWD